MLGTFVHLYFQMIITWIITCARVYACWAGGCAQMLTQGKVFLPASNVILSLKRQCEMNHTRIYTRCRTK